MGFASLDRAQGAPSYVNPSAEGAALKNFKRWSRQQMRLQHTTAFARGGVALPVSEGRLGSGLLVERSGFGACCGAIGVQFAMCCLEVWGPEDLRPLGVQLEAFRAGQVHAQYSLSIVNPV